ncbi:hydantoinase/oxoprolinase family protein [Xylophilus rhododendri]|uniref:Hydantoinase/oxoprolinase family protein n=1 Tax=Xylophilus rhododendri TaxID=2697032 RepID=A0A857J3P0_9BURK|nr:hydantoinase/oxoprolinase family protein [Xylophilus rhododendri]QHI98376.1 hydantoinase/oxoprolinase family protein [Xylophilus rhododendri]
MIRLSFDIGGTFTDFVLEDQTRGVTRYWKTLSTPSAPEKAVVQGVKDLLAAEGVAASSVGMLLHATTVATNAILERKGSRTALITTEGFRDVLLLGRQKRYSTYNMHLAKPEPLIRRRDIFELPERSFLREKAHVAPVAAEVDALLGDIVARGYEAVAICLLHSYVNPAHERFVAERAAVLGLEIDVSLSSEVSPRFREYERTSTVVANAYVKPIVSRYVRRLDQALKAEGIAADLYIMQSNGGLVSPELATGLPVRIVESGPAAGVLMCRAIGREEAMPDLLTFDMGGTTAKLGAIDAGEPAILPTFEVDQVQYTKGSGLPLNISAIEMLEIGAGGGSIAMAELGAIRIGPESAGSEPGPVCYGRGGTRPTVTDANLVLGYLNPGAFNGGNMQLDLAGARRAVEIHLAQPLGISIEEAALGIHLMATSNMERALRVMSVERGRDPAKYALVGFGGAGPVHAARLARNLHIPTLVLPRGAGVGSAVGLLAADPKVDYTVTQVTAMEPGALAAVRRLHAELQGKAASDLDRLSRSEAREERFTATARYAGQGYEINVDVPDVALPEGAFLQAFQEAFGEAYRKAYGYHDAARAVEAVDWTFHGSMPLGAGLASPSRPSEGEPRIGTRTAWFTPGAPGEEIAIYDRYRLKAGQPVTGPCVIEEAETTILLLHGDVAELSAHGNLIVRIGAKA